MMQPLALAVVLGWIGCTLLLDRIRWFRRSALADRIRPYVPGAASRLDPADDRSPVVQILGPLASDAGATLARLAGVHEDLGTRLERVHSPIDPTGFRLRQLGWIIASLGIAIVATIAAHPPIVVTTLFVAGAPVLAFLLVESGLSRRSDRWKRSLVLELPIVCEQLGMLLSAGYSLGAALSRLARRSEGAVSRDLGRVVSRVRHGLDENTALREWATTADVPAVGRLVGVLALNREAGDLGHLITNEARAVRSEVHRELVEVIERRGQQVWIPVTVATLLPGLLFLAVPFTEALRLFTTT
jgi:tight adherence protein C